MTPGKHLAGQVLVAAAVFHEGVCIAPLRIALALAKHFDESTPEREMAISDRLEFHRVYSAIATPEGR